MIGMQSLKMLRASSVLYCTVLHCTALYCTAIIMPSTCRKSTLVARDAELQLYSETSESFTGDNAKRVVGKNMKLCSLF